MAVAVLIKQVPKASYLALGEDRLLRREEVETEINPYCRRALAQGIDLAAKLGEPCVAVTMGPAGARRAVIEAVAAGADRGVHLFDRAFSGSDSLATARALAALLEREGPFSAVIAGKLAVDSETGAVPAQLAELLDLPLLSAARKLRLDGGRIWIESELDDGWLQASAELPAVISCAERLCSPAKFTEEAVAEVAPEAVTVVTASDLGPGEWGLAGSPTRVGRVRRVAVDRLRLIGEGDLAIQAKAAAGLARSRAQEGARNRPGTVPVTPAATGATVAVLCEPGRGGRELIGLAARLARGCGAGVVALSPGEESPGHPFYAWGADRLVHLGSSRLPDETAWSLAGWCQEERPLAVLVPATSWGREAASRAAAALGAGLVAEASGVEVDPESGRLVGVKPALAGSELAEIAVPSGIQLITVSPESQELLDPRAEGTLEVEVFAPAIGRSRVAVHASGVNDHPGALTNARMVIGVGQGVDPGAYAEIIALFGDLGVELAATRKVTDRQWLPRARQIGITGRHIAPELYVAVGLSGKFNHMVGVSAAGTVIAVNPDREAPVFDLCDFGIVAPWEEVLPLLARELGSPGEEAAS